MRFYIKATTDSVIGTVDRQLLDYLGDRLIAKTDAYDGYCYSFKINHHNVYRVFVLPDRLIFQCVQYAFDVNGTEFYDDAQDYKADYDAGNIDNWFNLIVKWIDECENANPEFTEYLEE